MNKVKNMAVDRARNTFKRMEAKLLQNGFEEFKRNASVFDPYFYDPINHYQLRTHPPGYFADSEVVVYVGMGLTKQHSSFRHHHPTYSIEVICRTFSPNKDLEELRGYFGIRGRPLNKDAQEIHRRHFV